MRKTSVIILSSLLICFIIVLSVGLVSTSTPSQKKVTKMYREAGYTHTHFSLRNKYTIHTYQKEDESLFIVWYANEDLAREGLIALNNLKGDDKVVLKRGKAVAFSDVNAIKIFKKA